METKELDRILSSISDLKKDFNDKFKKLDKDINNLNSKFENVNEKQAIQKTEQYNLKQQVENLEKRNIQRGERLEKLTNRITTLETITREGEKNKKSNNNWVWFLIPTFLSIVAITLRIINA